MKMDEILSLSSRKKDMFGLGFYRRKGMRYFVKTLADTRWYRGTEILIQLF